jgi:hypothetical protein
MSVKVLLAAWRAKRRIKRIVRRQVPGAKVFSSGSPRIDPHNLAIWIATRTDDERDRMYATRRLLPAFRQELFAAGYPPEAIANVAFSFESEETIARDFAGNWSYLTR